MITVTVDEFKNNFDKYFQEVLSGNDVIITDNGKRIARLSPERDSIDTDETGQYNKT